MHDEPLDPFHDDPSDPAHALDDSDDLVELSEDDRSDVEEDLADLEVYEALLAPSGVRGLVIDCEDCHEPHYFDWALMRANLRPCSSRVDRACTNRPSTPTRTIM